ncbi:MAG: hypothetical protein R3A78_01325 [Polyangiales bacterium]|nr:hypothetical protein [Myxococcales bacterium]
MTKQRVLGLLVLTGMVAVSSAAFAQGSSTGASSSTAGDTTTYNFDDDLVQGDLVRPDGEILSVRKLGKRSSLIRIREDFIPEMLKSVEDL